MPRSDQGVAPGRYQLIPRTLIFITRRSEVLLLKGAPGKRLWADRYNGIGGHVERGEDVLSAARRECAEETGLQISDLWLCGVVTVDAEAQVGIAIFVFRGAYDQGEIHASHEGTLAWVPFEQVLEYPLVEDLYTLLPRVLAMQPDDPPFSAHYAYDREDRLVIEFAPLG